VPTQGPRARLVRFASAPDSRVFRRIR
jgi:hypothetical protein